MDEGSLNEAAYQHAVQWNFMMVALKIRPEPNPVFELFRNLREVPGADSLQISYARN